MLFDKWQVREIPANSVGSLEKIWKSGTNQIKKGIISVKKVENVNSKCEKNIKKYNQASRANSSRHSANTISEVFQPNISRG